MAKKIIEAQRAWNGYQSAVADNIDAEHMRLTFGQYVRASVKRDLIKRNRALRVAADHIAAGKTMPLTGTKALELSVAMWRFLSVHGNVPKRTFANKYQDHAVIDVLAE